MESSRASFSSSSCSSSLSSLDCNKSTQQEHSIFGRNADDRANRRAAAISACASPRASPRQSIDFRDVVKDSIHREARGLPVKAAAVAEEEVKKRVMKHRDSPRPPPLSKSMDLDESLVGVLSKLKEAPRYSSEAKGASFFSMSREEAPPRASLDSREIKPAAGLGELPRLSLDSRREGLKSRKDSILRELERSNPNQRISRASASPREPGDGERSPGVVAKLMGLEALPCSSYAPPSRRAGSNEPTPVGGRDALEGLRKGSSSPRAVGEKKKGESVTPRRSGHPPPPIIPVETAPWEQQEKGRARQRHESVYGEIERKLKDAGFQKSDRDLRALKQILEAIQAKGLLEAGKGDEEKELGIPSENAFSRPGGSDESSRSADGSTRRGARAAVQSSTGVSAAPSHLGSPIVIMKPAKSESRCSSRTSVVDPLEGLAGLRRVRTGGDDCRAAKDRTPKNSLGGGDGPIHVPNENKSSTRMRAPQDSPRHQQPSSVGNVCTAKNPASSSSPRLLQPRRVPLEKKSSRSAAPPSDSCKHHRQSRSRMKPKPEQKLDAHPQIAVGEARTRLQTDEISQRSDSNVSKSPSCRSFDNAASIVKRQDSRQLRDDCTSEAVAITPELPSPVSVLDVSFYKDELQASPVRHSFMFEDQWVQNSEDISGEDGWNLAEVSKSSSNTLQLNKINHKKFQSIEGLVQKLKQLSSSSDDEAAADNDSMSCETQTPDHRYVSEILLASGLSSGAAGTVPLQLHHQSGYQIDPDLFLMLEEKKPESHCHNGSKPKSDPERIHRRLVFDTVNEILARKLESECPGPRPTYWLQDLLKRICLEIDQLGTNSSGGVYSKDDEDDALKPILAQDIARQSEGWTGVAKEVSELVLNIERSIFRDLIDEVVGGGSTMNLQVRSCRQSRQLFAK